MPKISGMFNDFLATDINENIDFCEAILTAITEKKTDCFCGNLYELEISQDKAILKNLYDDEIEAETMTLSDLELLLLKWRN